MIHRLPNNLEVEMVGADETGDYAAGDYGVYIRRNGVELVSWTGDEWIEDPSVVAAIINAVCTLSSDCVDCRMWPDITCPLHRKEG